MAEHQSADESYSLYQASGLVPNPFVIENAEQYQSDSGLQHELHESLQTTPASPDSDSSEKAQLSNTIQPSLELKSSPPADWSDVAVQSLSNSRSPPSPQLLSSSSGIDTGDAASIAIECPQPLRTPSITQLVDTAELLQHADASVRRDLEGIMNSDSSEHTDLDIESPNTTYHNLPPEHPPSMSTFDTAEGRQTPSSSCLPENSTPFRSIDTAKEEHRLEDHPREHHSSSPPLDTVERSGLQPSKLPSSSPGIHTPDHKDSSDAIAYQSSDLMGISSLGNTDEHSALDTDLLRQMLQRFLHPPNTYGTEESQLHLGHKSSPPESTLSETPVGHSISQTQFHKNPYQQSFAPYSGALSSPNQSESCEEVEEDEDLSPLEYARKNGLSRDHLNVSYPEPKLDVFGDCQDRLTDDSHLPQFDLTAIVNNDERLTIPKDAAMFLASVIREESSDWVDNALLRMIDTRRCRDLRLEFPLLRSDHETDCQKFAERRGFEIELKDIKFPLEMVDKDSNGGLGISHSLWTKSYETLESLKKEKIEVTRDTLMYLQNTLKGDWTDEDAKTVWESIHTYKRNTALEPVTPPLSPMISPAQPYEPSMSDSVFDVPVLSDPESLTKQDLEAIEEELFKNDVPTPIRVARDGHRSSDTLVGDDTVKMADIYSPAASLDRPLVSPKPETSRIKPDDLKVEEPLTPARPAELANVVQFDNLIMDWPAPHGSPHTEPFESTFFEEAFGEAHKKATRMSEQERLIAADTTARVDVPIMDFSPPIPPWQNTSRSPNSMWYMQNLVIKDVMEYGLSKWRSNGKGPHRWNPFPPKFAKVAMEEVVREDDCSWQAFVENFKADDIIDTSALTWKPPGLRILRENEDDDDEIEPAKYERGAPQELSYLIKKRKMEIDEREGSGSTAQGSPRQPPRKKAPNPNEFAPTAKKQSDHFDRGSLLMGGSFSVGNSVDNFLELRGAKKPKPTESSHFTKTTAQTETTPARPKPQPELLTQLPIRNSPAPKTATPLPAPPNNIVNTPVNVIVASTLLKHRVLIKHIEKLAQQIVLVERDFSAHDTTIWMPGSVARSPIASPLASEADIIVSPLVGIIITTLQKIKQKSLPGQKSKVAIRDRLEKVSTRYEKLIVLVTENRADESTRELDDSDCIAFSEFVAFAITLPTAVNVQFVGGGETTLAKWTVSCISSYKVDVELLGEETHWELFLRRAGLNAFAAQAIIAQVKAPDGVDMSHSSKAVHFGLAAFVEMGKEQRIARFGPICGNRLMERVGAVIDARWS